MARPTKKKASPRWAVDWHESAVKKRPAISAISTLCLSMIVAGFAFWGRVEVPDGRYVDEETGHEMIFRKTGFFTAISSGNQAIYKWEMKNLSDIQEWMEQARIQRLDEHRENVAKRDEILKLEKERRASPDYAPIDGFDQAIDVGRKSERRLDELSGLSGEEFFFPDSKLKRTKVIVIAKEGLFGWHFEGTAVIQDDHLIITSTGQKFKKAK